MKQKLELQWVGKNSAFKLEPRILIENQEFSVGDSSSDNMLIHGDNLLALKALERDFFGKIKCIYIDPPYNTGQAFEHYDDGIETSLWLSLMKARLEILRHLLADDGAIFVQIDDRYLAHLRIIMDEVFGSAQYINTITIKTKASSGASGGGEDRRLKKNIEFILVYSGTDFKSFNPVFNDVELSKYLDLMRLEEKSFKYTTVLTKTEGREFVKTIKDGSGNDMRLYRITDYETKSISKLAKDENLSEVDVIKKYYEKVFTTENAQTSIRTRVQEATDKEDNMYALEYVPISGRNKGKKTELLFVGAQKRLVSWFQHVTIQNDGKIYKREKLGTLWDDLNWNNVTREGGVRFPNGQKPEKLISICIDLSTNEGDLVLDSFLGSGTTAAVAHKMNRRWIGIELKEHCLTHCVPRLRSVVEGQDSKGVSEEYQWTGGGGFKFYELAPSLLDKDFRGNWVISENYDAAMLSRAVCAHEGFRFSPDPNIYWKQGKSTEKDFIFVTTQFLSASHVDYIVEQMKSDETLLICAKSFKFNASKYKSITVKKIPQMLLGRCEFGKDDYSLNIVEPIQGELGLQ